MEEEIDLYKKVGESQMGMMTQFDFSIFKWLSLSYYKKLAVRLWTWMNEFS